MKKYLNTYLFILFVLAVSVIADGGAYAASANLNQARNGTDSLPINPLNWVNGNLGVANTHYIEGMSSPYQCIMTGLTIGSKVTLTIGYDVKNSNKHAIDYLTHYNRLLPHDFNYHSTPETIDPLAGTGLAANTPFTTYPIPAPASTGSPVAGQPTASFNSLPANERVMTLYNGTIDSIYYVTQGNLASNSSEARVDIVFTPATATVVLLWGGHIGSRINWGYTSGFPNSAGGISGSPFHMRLVAWTIDNLGNQDRSLSGASVSGPPMPLPVELVHFSVHAEEKSNVVEWTTASEINNDYFTIERSSGITHFESLATEGGAGNSSTIRNYSWTDDRPLPGMSYYRLVQTDYDGSHKIFGPVSVQTNGKQLSLSEFIVYANVFSDDFNISYYAPFKGDVQLEIISLEGKLIQSDILKSEAGTNFTVVRNQGISAKGIYLVRISQGINNSLTQKFIKN